MTNTSKKAQLDIIKLFDNMPNDLDYDYKSNRKLKKNKAQLNKLNPKKETNQL